MATLLIALWTTLSLARLEPGTVVPLVLQRTLSTHLRGGLFGVYGGKPITREGSAVMYEVAEDVRDRNGRVVIAQGTPAVGRVIDSQPAQSLRPTSRLAVTVERTWTVDDKPMTLQFERRHEGRWAYRFGRADSGRYAKSLEEEQFELAFREPINQVAVSDFVNLLVRGEIDDLVRNPERLLKLRTFARQSGLRSFVEFLQDGGAIEIIRLIAEIQSGSFAISRLADVRHLVRAFGLVNDAWQAGRQITGWVEGRLKGPQILVPAGFPMTAVVSG